MPCYQCVHCGKCPVGNLKTAITCRACGAPLGPGVSACPACGADLMGNMRAHPDDLGLLDRTYIAHLGKGGKS